MNNQQRISNTQGVKTTKKANWMPKKGTIAYNHARIAIINYKNSTK
jgi:hypothetical protein